MQDCSRLSKLVDDDDPTSDEEMDYEHNEDVVDEANFILVYDSGDDEARVPREYSYLLLCFTCALRTMLIFKV